VKKRRRSREESFHRRTPPGAAPGTVAVDPDAPRPLVRLVAYDAQKLVEREDPNLKQIPALQASHAVTWLDLDGLGDRETILQVGEMFGLHQLALEDVVNVHQRPKIENYGDFLFVVARMPIPGEDRLSTEQLSLFLGRNFVVTFQEGVPGDCLDPVRLRLRDSGMRIRGKGADFLAYAILDSLVDSYFPLLESYGERLETLEEDVLGTPSRETIVLLQLIKRDLLTLRRVFWPLREAVSGILKDPCLLIQDETRVFLRDVSDHTVQLLDLLETYREIAAGLVDLYLSSVSNRMNEIMKTLTIVSTIFIPLSFLAGLYGMNFDTRQPWNMPELGWRYGYLFVLSLMASVALGLLAWIYRRGWLSTPEPPDHRAVDRALEQGRMTRIMSPADPSGKANGP
jgi:magnesium transporter